MYQNYREYKIFNKHAPLDLKHCFLVKSSNQKTLFQLAALVKTIRQKPAGVDALRKGNRREAQYRVHLQHLLVAQEDFALLFCISSLCCFS